MPTELNVTVQAAGAVESIAFAPGPTGYFAESVAAAISKLPEAETEVISVGGAATVSAGIQGLVIDATAPVTVVALGSESVLGGSGGITFTGAANATYTIAIAGGNDSISMAGGSAYNIQLGAGDNTVAAGGSGTIEGGAGGSSTIIGGSVSSANNFIFLDGTNDVIAVGAGAATVSEQGNDGLIVGSTVFGTANVLADSGTNDTVAGGAGADTIFGHTNGTYYLSTDTTVFEAQNGAAELIVGEDGGEETVFGGTADFVIVNATQLFYVADAYGSATINSDRGYSQVLGSQYSDIVFLQNAASVPGGDVSSLIAEAGPETINASFASAMVLISAGSGNDSIAGGSGNDAFVFSAGTTSLYGGTSDTISGFHAGELLEFGGYSGTAGSVLATETVANGNTTLTLSDGTRIELAGYTGGLSTSNPGATGYYTITACYLEGTRLMTDAGEVAIEDLRIGDLLLTKDFRFRPIKWIGRRSYDARFVGGNIHPVCIRQGALGENSPKRDLLVSPEHAMLIDGMLIPAILLVNGGSITQHCDRETISYLHVELETHDAILAEGALSETFVDDFSRMMFHNAAEYAALYPGSPPAEAAYCAARVECGPALEAVRARIAARAGDGQAEPEAARKLHGFIDLARRDFVEGWAWDPEAGDAPVILRVTDDGMAIGFVVADLYREDLKDAGVGSGHHAFRFEYPGGLAPDRPHSIAVSRAEDGVHLRGSPAILPADAPRQMVPISRDADAITMKLNGCVDRFTRNVVEGWAQDDTGYPVPLQILVNGRLVARTLANKARPDLAVAGIGQGRHAFVYDFPGGLSPLIRQTVSVQRDTDGTELKNPCAPLEPSTSFDTTLCDVVAQAVDALEDTAAQDRALVFLAEQADRVAQARARQDAQWAERDAHRRLERRHGSVATTRGLAGAVQPGRRALFIDADVPDPRLDAGGQAAVSHMRALQALGYAVSFTATRITAADQAALAALEAIGIRCCHAPWYASVEEVLQRQAGGLDVVYLHRAAVAASYLTLVRQHHCRARIVYGVADLHHMRVGRHAELHGRPDLAAESERLRLAETLAAWMADAVITHSPVEARLLQAMVPRARIHVVPWAIERDVAPPPTCAADAADRIAFIGNFAHAPNADGVRYLAEEVMPLAWQQAPKLECLLVGSRMPDEIRRLAARSGLQAIGFVADLDSVFAQVRATVAPLRFGAGIKGKILTSLAAGVACVATPIAAEGLACLPAFCIGDTPQALARAILHLCRDEAARAAGVAAGRAHLGLWTQEAVNNALRGVLEDRLLLKRTA
jgi:glycosyltransferase involved in cell wall biosynthesis/Ca2+-binding RTX toxin-like protein